MDTNDLNYGRLAKVLEMAYDQAATGKGSERHGNGLPFEQQPMQTISALLGGYDGLAFQVCKKVAEARNLPTKEQRVRELLGAINYVAGMIIYEDRAQTADQGLHSGGVVADRVDDRTMAERLNATNHKSPTDPMSFAKGSDDTLTQRTENPLDSVFINSRRGERVKRLVNAEWLLGVKSEPDSIVICSSAKTAQPGEATVNALVDAAGALAKANKGADVVINLSPGMLQNYRASMVGELLNYHWMQVKNADVESDQITLAYVPPSTE